MARKPQPDNSPRISNRRALHDYFVLEKLETGIVLKGSEVKSVRNGQVQLSAGFVRVEPDVSLVLHNVDIAPYSHAGPNTGHEPKRPRRLLAHKRQILKLAEASNQKGTTLVPLAMYFVRGKVKVEIGLVTGKKSHDKRQDMKARDAQREMQRAMSRKRL